MLLFKESQLSVLFLVYATTSFIIGITILAWQNDDESYRPKRLTTAFKEQISNSMRRLDGLTDNCGRTPLFNWSHGGAFCSEIGPKKNGKHRFSAGYYVRPGEFPSYVSLEFKGSTERRILCGGILVDQDIVLTASHCISEEMNSCRARMGFVNINETEHMQTEFAWGWCKLPNFVYDEYFGAYNDVGLLQLRGPVNYTDYVQPACVANRDSHHDEAQCYSVGMGKVENEGPSSDNLIGLPMKRGCDRKPEHIDEEGRTCYQANDKRYLGNPCVGDSGGAMYCIDKCNDNATAKQYVVGSISFGPVDACVKGEPFYSMYADFFKLSNDLTFMLETCYEFH